MVAAAKDRNCSIKFRKWAMMLGLLSCELQSAWWKSDGWPSAQPQTLPPFGVCLHQKVCYAQSFLPIVFYWQPYIEKKSIPYACGWNTNGCDETVSLGGENALTFPPNSYRQSHWAEAHTDIFCRRYTWGANSLFPSMTPKRKVIVKVSSLSVVHKLFIFLKSISSVLVGMQDTD